MLFYCNCDIGTHKQLKWVDLFYFTQKRQDGCLSILILIKEDNAVFIDSNLLHYNACNFFLNSTSSNYTNVN